MTRPGIVRADTLDLQDQDSPSAQDHSRSNGNQNDFGDRLVGAHHAQEIRHIKQERHEEENNLQQAWEAATDGTGAALGVNGAEDGRVGEAEVETGSEDDMMDRISSSPSITDEDIDFDFVYALHTFVATVEGQADATKGDTMVLLDDTNSYWWLVRVVKDSSIGYLPAEHIETPTERLARLNKHRNVDLSAAMLGDNAEKSKNPLKKAMKRRGAKTVQFAPPTYVEASDYDYSDDDDDDDDNAAAEARAAHTAAIAANGAVQQQSAATTTVITPDTVIPATDGTEASVEDGSANPRSPDDRAEAAPLKSRSGTTRNADSFLKDDSAETRKFTLTPNLLRDDTIRTGGASDGGRSRGGSPTSDSSAPSDSPKGKKEKKPRTLSGLFKSSKKREKDKDKENGRDKDRENGRDKDKLAKKEFVSEGDVERASFDAARQSTVSLPVAGNAKAVEAERENPKKARKLQKQQSGSAAVSQAAPLADAAPPQQGPTFAELEGSQVAYEAPTGLEDEIPAVKSKKESKGAKVKKARKREVLDDFDEVQENGTATSGSFMHGTEVVHIPHQVEYESSADDKEEVGGNEMDTTGGEKEGSTTPPSLPETDETPLMSIHDDHDTRRVTTEVPDARLAAVTREQQASYRTHSPPGEIISAPPTRQAPPLPSEAEPTGAIEVPTSIVQTTPTEHTAEHTAERTTEHTAERTAERTAEHTTEHTAVPTARPDATHSGTWNDAALRAWLDGENNDMHDMLTVVYDTTGVKPAGPDHPLMKGYLVEERTQLDAMMAELDRLHHDFVKRRGGSGAAAVVAAT